VIKPILVLTLETRSAMFLCVFKHPTDAGVRSRWTASGQMLNASVGLGAPSGRGGGRCSHTWKYIYVYEYSSAHVRMVAT